MRRIDLSCYGIVVEVDDAKNNGENPAPLAGAITSALLDDRERDEGDAEVLAALNAIESLILAHGCAGVDIASPAYKEGIEVDVEKLIKEYD